MQTSNNKLEQMPLKEVEPLNENKKIEIAMWLISLKFTIAAFQN